MGVDKMKVAHVLPGLDVGGVEVAVQRSLAELSASYDYRLFYVRRHGGLELGQRHVSFLLWNLLRGSWRPDAVLTSLWWAHPFGWILKCCGIRWFAFFHSAGFSGRLNRFVLSWAWRRADERLADSRATAAAMGQTAAARCRLVPYRFRDASVPGSWSSRCIDIIYTGRNAPVKRLDLLARFVWALASRVPSGRAVFAVAGAAPDTLADLHPPGWCVEVVVDLPNERVRELLREARFFVLLSEHEGMSMSTVEAIDAGCVPIVRPVGEIPSYLGSDYCFIAQDVSPHGLDQLADMVAAHWRDEVVADAIVPKAIRSLERFPGYVESIKAALNEGAFSRNRSDYKRRDES